MRTEARFLLAVGLMLAVLIGTNRLFPPVVPKGAGAGAESSAVGGAPEDGAPAQSAPTGGASEAGGPDELVGEASRGDAPRADAPPDLPVGGREAAAGAVAEEAPTKEVVVEGPLYRFRFSSRGARLVSAELLGFEAINRGGPVELIPEGADGYLGSGLVVGNDTLDLRDVPFSVEPAEGLRLEEGGGPRTLRFVYEHPSGDVGLEVGYTFEPEFYQIKVAGELRGVRRALLVTDMGAGLAYAEADSALEKRSMAYVYNHLQDGIRSTTLEDADPTIVEGPLLWSAFRNKFFVLALLAGESDELAAETSYLGGLIVRDSELADRARVSAAQTITEEEGFAFRLFMGPQEYTRLSSLGQGMEEVNPYGWRFFRPLIRPFVSVIMTILVFFHTQVSLGYGWVLILFGVLMRVVLFPLNHKAMKAQLRNMAVQPLVKQIQEKHKDNPEKLQKEMMRLYKEHGFNPLAGCLPMLLPWPVLIALFFVFQNTIELRGVEFLWLPDLSAKDPYYILPVILALSMFLMQWVSLRSLDQDNPQMKMMMYIMPPMMLFIFMNLASGLNLYYATANIATLPQQVWIARERAKMKGGPPLTLASRD